MPITDPSAIAYCNTVIRPLADALTRFYYDDQTAADEFIAKGLATLIPNDGAQIVVDGAPADGRTQITGADVNILLANAATIKASMDATSKLILNQTLKVAVNPK